VHQYDRLNQYDRLVSSFMGFIRIACSLILMRDVLI